MENLSRAEQEQRAGRFTDHARWRDLRNCSKKYRLRLVAREVRIERYRAEGLLAKLVREIYEASKLHDIMPIPADEIGELLVAYLDSADGIQDRQLLMDHGQPTELSRVEIDNIIYALVSHRAEAEETSGEEEMHLDNCSCEMRHVPSITSSGKRNLTILQIDGTCYTNGVRAGEGTRWSRKSKEEEN
tara:strand:- start:155 stop:718 length:564 start_codon:yes stop_codon:yes gene_type:complete